MDVKPVAATKEMGPPNAAEKARKRDRPFTDVPSENTTGNIMQMQAAAPNAKPIADLRTTAGMPLLSIAPEIAATSAISPTIREARSRSSTRGLRQSMCCK
jgi:hypothetical protein